MSYSDSIKGVFNEAVALERKNNWMVAARIILGGNEVKVGDEIDIEIELVNAGKASA